MAQSTFRGGLWLKIHWEEGEVNTENLRGDAGAEVWATGQRQLGRGGLNQKGVCGSCGSARGGRGRAPGEDDSFVTLLFSGAMAANGGNGITPV